MSFLETGLTFMVVFSLAVIVALAVDLSRMEDRAIEHGCAGYNQTTGELEWYSAGVTK